jgi:hypothetical protein
VAGDTSAEGRRPTCRRAPPAGSSVFRHRVARRGTTRAASRFFREHPRRESPHSSSRTSRTKDVRVQATGRSLATGVRRRGRTRSHVRAQDHARQPVTRAVPGGPRRQSPNWCEPCTQVACPLGTGVPGEVVGRALFAGTLGRPSPGPRSENVGPGDERARDSARSGGTACRGWRRQAAERSRQFSGCATRPSA